MLRVSVDYHFEFEIFILKRGTLKVTDHNLVDTFSLWSKYS